MATRRSFFRLFGSLRRLVLVVVGVVIILLVLRTPTAPYFNPGREHPPPPPPTGVDGDKYPRRRLPIELQDFLVWDPPTDQPEHYPSYDAYQDTDFDPNRWEAFQQYVHLEIVRHNRLYTR